MDENEQEEKLVSEDASLEFDPLKPCLKAIEGDLHTKCSQAVNIMVKDVLPKLLARCEDGIVKVATFAKSMVDLFEEEIAGIAETPEPAQETLTILRILHTMADPSVLNFDLDDLAPLAGGGSQKKTAVSEFGALVGSNPFYTGRLNDVREVVQRGLPAVESMREYLAAIDSLPHRVEEPVCAKLLEVVQRIKEWQSTLRKGLTLSLENAVFAFVKDLIARIPANDNSTLERINLQTLNTFGELLQAAYHIWRDDDMFRVQKQVKVVLLVYS